MGGGANFFLRRRHALLWTEGLQAQVGFSLLLLVFLAIPAFFLILQKTYLVAYYLGYPIIASFGLYLISRGKNETGSVIIILSVYGVILWLSWLIGFAEISPLKWWIISLLPWVMLGNTNRIGVGLLSGLAIVFSLALPYLFPAPGQLLPAEQNFLRQILSISVALGAFSCIFFLRKYYFESEKLRVLENEFYSNALNTIPLPIIIKDGITLDFVFFNQAAQLTYDLNPNSPNSNTTTFSESSAAAVSRLDQEVLRSVTYHIEPDENFVHQSGLHWHFRTYRIPLELKSSGRRLLITVSEDLRAWNLITKKSEENKEQLNILYHYLPPLLFRFEPMREKLTFLSPPQNLESDGWHELKAMTTEYLHFHLTRNARTDSAIATHRFKLKDREFVLFCGRIPGSEELSGVMVELAETT